MPRFFSAAGPDGNTILLQGEDAKHLRLALRARIGERITVCDGAGTDFDCEITAINAENVVCRVLRRERSQAENPYFTTLYLALTKGDKFELVLQKSVELGADRLVPVLTERCVSRPDAAEAARKVERWQKIAQAAAKQCGRGKIPEVAQMLSFRQATEAFCAHDLPLFCYEKAEKPLSDVLNGLPEPPETVAAFVGAEGGFSPEEAKAVEAAGGIAVSLGHRILRAETAPLALLCCVNYALGGF